MLKGHCDQGALAKALRVLLGHYYQRNETPEMRTRLIADFVRDLAEMSDATVGWAIAEWRRNNDRRPSPATLRQLCMVRRQEAMAAQKARAPRHARPPDASRTAERGVAFRHMATAVGFVEDARGQLAFAEDVAAPPRVPHWTETVRAGNPLFVETLRAARRQMRGERNA